MGDENLLAEFEEYSRCHPVRCVVGRRIDQLAEPERVKIQAALDAEHITAAAIQKWLAARDLRVGDGSVKKHRIGECCCA